MYAQVEKSKENSSRIVENSVTGKKRNGNLSFGFVDNRPEAVAQRKLRRVAKESSPKAKEITQTKILRDGYSLLQQYSSHDKHGVTKPLVVQRNQRVTQYAPDANNSMSPGFIDQHAPQGDDDYTVENAIEIHEIRGALDTNTIIAISGQEMADEINQYLLGLSDIMSQRLEDEEWNQITFTTENEYPSIETVLDNDGQPVFSEAEITRIQVRMQFMNGYYRVYHFSGRKN
jgi:hypothetical protein